MYKDMDANRLEAELETQRAAYEEIKARGLALNMARGKPAAAQLDLSMPMLDILKCEAECFAEDGTDCRNYGVLDGIPEAKRLMAVLLDDEPENVIVLGNASLTAMHDAVARYLQFGCLGSAPWSACERVRFVCPVPGYDRHFAILEQFGIEAIAVPMTDEGPDMGEVERIVSSDASVKGIWCVPKYSNPSGVTYSDEVVRRLAHMDCAAEDFRIFWDNAYCVHDLYAGYDEQDHVLDIGIACVEAGNPDRFLKFASTSKVTFPGAGICGMAASAANVAEAKKLLGAQMIGCDKLNQLRHARFLPDEDAVRGHMARQAEVIRPKFELVWSKLEEGLGGAGIATWTRPRGGYFVSFDGMEGTARRTVQLARDAGVVLTSAGATWPHGIDPRDNNIRIAPTMPSLDELSEALDVFVCCAKIAALEALSA